MQLKAEHPGWGAPKIREKLKRKHNDVQTPAISTVHTVLDRHGLVDHGRKRRHKAQGTTLSKPGLPNDLWCAITVTQCGRICIGRRRKINLSTLFTGQNVGVKQVSDRIWLVSFMDYDLGFFDDETCRLEPAANPFEAKVLPMSPE